MVDRIPPPLLEGLNGGITIRRHAHRRPDDPPGVHLLGEYVSDESIGCLIILYYGSFRRLFRGEPPELWEAELWETLRHEVRHHVEACAGLYDLDLEDVADLRHLWAEWEAGRGRADGKAGGGER